MPMGVFMSLLVQWAGTAGKDRDLAESIATYIA